MSIFQVKLKDRREIASGTMAFQFEKPAGFAYKAGQTGDLTLLNPAETDGEGNIRTFTFASAPYESDLMMATRMRDTAFKRVMKTMELGTELQLEAPFGSFTLHTNDKIPAVFLAGGIGITPVRSIVLQAAHARLPHKIVLFDSNRRPREAAFWDDLTRAQAANPNFRLVGTMTHPDATSQGWTGETGHISAAMIARAIDDPKLPIYYVSGPRAMVAAMRPVLEELGVIDDNIRTEEFSGY